jgi:hypothetical protein
MLSGAGLEKLSHESLRQPEDPGVDENAHLNLLVIAGVEQEQRFATSATMFD